MTTIRNLQTVSVNKVVVTKDQYGHGIPTIVNFFDGKAEVRTVELISNAETEGGQVRDYRTAFVFRFRYTANTEAMSRNLVGYSMDYKGVNYRLKSATVYRDRGWIEFQADNSGVTVV